MSDTYNARDILEDLQATDNPIGTGVVPHVPVARVDTDRSSSAEDTEKKEDYNAALVSNGIPWIPLLKRLSINLFIPFVNGIMLGFGEIVAHEVGLIFGWRTANVVDPEARPPSTNPRTRRKWLFGLY